MNYYEHHLGDYLRDTAHLTMIEDGAYRRLLDSYYLRESALPSDIGQTCRLVRASSKAERAAVESVLREFFHERADGWYHKRCEEEIERVRNRSVAARYAGLASADAKRQRKLNGCSTDAQPTVNERSTNHPTEFNLPISNLQSPVSEGASRPRRKASRRCPDEFEPDREFALREIPDLDVDREVQKFRDWEFKTPRSDWPAAWRTWIGNCRDRGSYAKSATSPGAIQWQ